MKKYKTSKYRGEITEYEVVRETPKTVVFMHTPFVIGPVPSPPREVTEKKETEYHRWHDTWEAAQAYLIERATNRIAYIEKNLEEARFELAQARTATKVVS